MPRPRVFHSWECGGDPPVGEARYCGAQCRAPVAPAACAVRRRSLPNPQAPDFTRDDVPLEIYPDVVSEEEEAAVLADIESQLSRRPYEAAHWDSVIDQYREIERPFPRLPPSALAVAERMMAFFEDQERIVPAVHFLDLAADGEIRHHVDSVKFSGPHIVILSLLSPALLHLQHQHSDAQVLLYAPRRSVYVMRDASRYDWSHAVLKGSYTFRPFPGGGLEDVRTVDRQRRISFIMRDLPPGEEVPTRSGTGAM